MVNINIAINMALLNWLLRFLKLSPDLVNHYDISVLQVTTNGMVPNAIFNNIPVISWQSVLLVEETGENQRPVASH
jgi:hypothetical protein